MKKRKRPAPVSSASDKGPSPVRPQPRAWWPWAVALGALFLVFEAYTPALDGAFVLDDRALAFGRHDGPQLTFGQWVGTLRPLLMASYWFNFQSGGANP